MSKLYFVSSNEGKIDEAQKILGFPIEIAKLEVDEVQSLSVEYIIRKKAEEAYKKLKKPLVIDDAGLYIETWNGFPGPFIKYLTKAGGNELLLRMLSGETNRKVVARAVIGFHDGKNIHTFIGEMKGEIALEPRGKYGWGFDPIFIIENTGKTCAEMGEEQKNKLSHRYAALKKFKMYIQENNISFGD